MRRPLLLLVVISLAAGVSVGQAQPPASVCEIHLNKIKPGMTAQYEQGRAKHMAWHKSQNDTWTWTTWEIVTGDNTGNYLVGSCGHPWKDFDGREKFQAADSANAVSSMGASEAGDIMSYYVLRADLAPASMQGPEPAYLSVTHFFLKPEGLLDFSEGAKKATAAMSKATGRKANWYSLVNGGRGPEMVLVQQYNNISDLQGPGKTVDQVVQEAYGDQGTAIMSSIRKAYYSSSTELLHYRPDLSYMAAGTKP